MAFKFVILFATLAAVNAGVLQPAGVYQHTQALYPQAAAIVKQPVYSQPAYVQSAPVLYKQPALIKQVVHEEPANYEFNYDVHDQQTGDIKQQHEKAINGAIQGQYSLIDADGYRRIVDYTADDHQGFQANVRREPLHEQRIVKTVQPVLVKKVIAQPAIAVQKLYAQPAPWQAPAQPWQAQAHAPWSA
ncbi:CLUMA_CG013837, isoform A [Clunio marinus]|uniref:CLUMA_CG013837, isoform A n=1 Tax=Clunio marinus TaxID=568069 RepID=A0A1J1IPZ9_9DIPT|nr:CLUMA_CG013837, isoform A [Clunio marinus]